MNNEHAQPYQPIERHRLEREERERQESAAESHNYCHIVYPVAILLYLTV